MDIETFKRLENEDCITVFIASNVKSEIERRGQEDYNTIIDTDDEAVLQEILNVSEGVDLDNNLYYQIDDIVDDFLFNWFDKGWL